jgi:hypothetical protein
MSNKKRLGFIIIGLIVVCTTLVFAGKAYELICKSCGYKAEVRFGGGKQFDQLTGFCVQCGDFVYIRWGRNEKKPEPLGRVWNPATGESSPVYACPECGRPFLAISSIHDMKHCPKCDKETLESKLKMIID